MKKKLAACLILCNLVLLLFSCKEKQVNVSEELAVSQNEAVSAKSSISSDGTEIDYDLSEMNSNMVYAEVFNMMIEPEIYGDKVIKMKGNFAVYPNSPTANGGTSYAVIISDALACCQQGIEFKYDFNGTFPKEGDEITVTGVFVTAFINDDLVYNYVRADSVEM